MGTRKQMWMDTKYNTLNKMDVNVCKPEAGITH